MCIVYVWQRFCGIFYQNWHGPIWFSFYSININCSTTCNLWNIFMEYIYGINSGQHMFVTACYQFNVLTTTFLSSSRATNSAFTIKVTMVELNAPASWKLLKDAHSFSLEQPVISAPLFTNPSGVLLYIQDYCSCIRSARTICSIFYYSPAFTILVPIGDAAIN